MKRDAGWRSLNQNANTLNSSEYGIERIVYKPADVEFDCRIMGNSEVINRIRPGGYNQPPLVQDRCSPSLSEKINDILHEERKLQLPTYVILPYHPASTLAPTWNQPQVVDIRRSYGFMQYLTHRPHVTGKLPSLSDLGALLQGYKRTSWLEESDYITAVPKHPADFYFIWGQLMAMAVTFSLSDLHRQNTIVHRSPYPPGADSAAYPPAPPGPNRI